MFCTAVQTCYRDYSINFFVYIFIYFFLFINLTKRPGSLTEQAPLQVPEKKKISYTTNKNDNTKK